MAINITELQQLHTIGKIHHSVKAMLSNMFGLWPSLKEILSTDDHLSLVAYCDQFWPSTKVSTDNLTELYFFTSKPHIYVSLESILKPRLKIVAVSHVLLMCDNVMSSDATISKLFFKVRALHVFMERLSLTLGIQIALHRNREVDLF